LADEKKEEEKKSDYHPDLDSESKKRMARMYRTRFINQGYSPIDAHNLGILQVRKFLRDRKIEELQGKILELNQGVLTANQRHRPDIEHNLKDIIEKHEEVVKKLENEIRIINKDISRIEEKKDILGKGYFDIEQAQKKKLKGLEDLKKKLPKEEYEKEKQKIEGFYKDVFETRAEDIKDLRKKAGVASRFTCDVCGKGNLYESYDKDTGQLTYKCTNKKCKVNKWKRKKLLPEEVYKDRWFVRNVPILKWKSRELAHARMTSESRVEDLEKKYREGLIDEEELKEGKERIKKEVYGDTEAYERDIEAFKRNNPGATRNDIKAEADRLRKKHKIKDRTVVEKYGGGLRKFAHTGEDFVKKVIFIVALIGIGAVIAASLGNMWFFFGFLSLGLYFLTPPPSEIKDYVEGPLSWQHMIPFGQKGGNHSGFAWIRSITKVSAIICFAYGFKSMGDIFNIFFIITCLVGYFSLKLSYDPKQPGEFIESLLRFGILGCYFIPLYVFASIFNSYVLAAIAFAFFAIPPMPNTSKGQDLTEVLARGLSGQTAYYEMFDKLLFSGLMLFALIGSGALGAIPLFNVGWQLEGTLKYTFIYFWIVSAIGGFFSPARERPLTGILFLGGATIIYGIGPGSQDIGSALLGQWWPTVNSAVTSVSEPITKMFSQLGKTFGDAFLLLTNPVGYATQLMNGSYANNPVGETGPIGVELTEFDVTPVFIEQPFMITANVKNNGGYDAQNVGITMAAGYWSPERKIDVGVQTIPGVVRLKISQIGMDLTSCANTKDKDSACTHYFDSATEPSDAAPKTFTRQNIWQTVFSSNGIKCDITSSYDLRKKSIPINITLTYKYQTDSTLGKGTDKLEFISQAEWDRLARLDQLNTRLKTILSESTSGPVLFPIGTPGLKSPILETQDFHIALSLKSQQAGGRIQSIESVVLNYPLEFPMDTCTPDASTGIWSMDKGTPGKVIWTPKSSSTPIQGDTMFFCHFKSFKGEGRDVLKGTPTKSYIITAHASYTYSNSKEKLVKVEFGSWCCAESLNPKGECASTSKCCSEQYPGQSKGKGICIPNEQNCGGGTTTAIDCTNLGEQDCLKYPNDCVWSYVGSQYQCVKKQ